jgi:hypothetical protein
MALRNAIDDDIHIGAVSDQVGREFVEICGQDMDLLGNDGSRGDIVFFRCVPGGDDVTVAQMKSGSANEDFARLIRCPLVLRVL